MKVMRKERILAKDHGEYVRAERNVLTAVFHPYIVTLRCSFQVGHLCSLTTAQQSFSPTQCDHVVCDLAERRLSSNSLPSCGLSDVIWALVFAD